MTISTSNELIRVLLTTKWQNNRSRITYLWFLTPYSWLLRRTSTRQATFWKHFLLKVYWSLDYWIKRMHNDKIKTRPVIIPRLEETNPSIFNYTSSNRSLTLQTTKSIYKLSLRASLYLLMHALGDFIKILRQI